MYSYAKDLYEAIYTKCSIDLNDFYEVIEK